MYRNNLEVLKGKEAVPDEGLPQFVGRTDRRKVGSTNDISPALVGAFVRFEPALIHGFLQLSIVVRSTKFFGALGNVAGARVEP